MVIHGTANRSASERNCRFVLPSTKVADLSQMPSFCDHCAATQNG
ncbi:hypothetical protein ANCCAN_01091 [Ancylostoma caninum]|uniref:Uncharacterized protein n=1 Tax=Ancylostoma caninum TaxID=29170 RepID=A0A368HBU1_ANCCA|nr:hypothetical protein ANCCAN_01091 [Ancylostoma caninum]